MDIAPWNDVIKGQTPEHHIIKQMTFMLKEHRPDQSHEDIYNTAVSYADSIINPENQNLPSP